MGTYLMMLYVSVEQELAVKDLFTDRGWGFSKPDLRVTTDDVGPLIEQTIPDNNVIHVFAQQEQDQTQQTTADGTNLSDLEPFMQQLMPVSKPTRVVRKVNKQVKQTVKVPVPFPQVANETEMATMSVDQTANRSDSKPIRVVRKVINQVNRTDRVPVSQTIAMFAQDANETAAFSADQSHQISPEVKVKVEQSYIDDNTSDTSQVQYDHDYESAQSDHGGAKVKDQSVPNPSTSKVEISSSTESPPKPKKRKKTSQGGGAKRTGKILDSKTGTYPLNNKRGTYHTYDQASLEAAYNYVKIGGMSVFAAARMFAVPESTLRERVRGFKSIDLTTSGHPPLFDQEEESLLLEHIKQMANLGYGYTRTQIIKIASDYAFDIGKKDKAESDKLSDGWYNHFVKRCPEIHAVKASNSAELRERACSKDYIANYCSELETILVKHGLKDKPEYIYCIDEATINAAEEKEKLKIDIRGKKTQLVKSEETENVTILGCGSASGSVIPPYLVFPSKSLLPELLDVSTLDCDSAVNQTADGHTNTEIFTNYVKKHFHRFLPDRNTNQPVLLLYDGHKCDIAISLIQWAVANNIILFLLPPHCSQILQPNSVGCLSSFENLYKEKSPKLQQSIGQSGKVYNMCTLICKVYEQVLSPVNLRTFFRITGIYPFCPTVVTESYVNE